MRINLMISLQITLLVVTVLSLAGVFVAGKSETARGLFISILVLECVAVLSVICSKIVFRSGQTSYQVCLGDICTTQLS